MSDISCLAATERGGFVAVSSRHANAVMFDKDGIQISKIGRRGSGPFEYRMPTLVKVKGDSVIIWDANGLKFIIWSLDGQPISEATGMSEAISDFAFLNNEIILFLSGHRTGQFVARFDLSTKAIVQAFGERNREHNLLMRYFGSGGLAVKNSVLYYAGPEKDLLYSVDLTTKQLAELPLGDPDFRVGQANIDLRTREEFERAKEYIFNTSRICGLFSAGRYLLVQVEDGRTDDNTRVTKIFVWDVEQRKVVDMFRLDHARRKEHGELIQAANSRSVYTLVEIPRDNEGAFERVVTEWRIQPVN